MYNQNENIICIMKSTNIQNSFKIAVNEPCCPGTCTACHNILFPWWLLKLDSAWALNGIPGIELFHETSSNLCTKRISLILSPAINQRLFSKSFKCSEMHSTNGPVKVGWVVGLSKTLMHFAINFYFLSLCILYFRLEDFSSMGLVVSSDSSCWSLSILRLLFGSFWLDNFDKNMLLVVFSICSTNLIFSMNDHKLWNNSLVLCPLLHLVYFNSSLLCRALREFNFAFIVSMSTHNSSINSKIAFSLISLLALSLSAISQRQGNSSYRSIRRFTSSSFQRCIFLVLHVLFSHFE